MATWKSLPETDPETLKALNGEIKRENTGLELIPSENYVSKAVMTAMGSVFNNKYSEGYSGKRYYGGQEFTDAVETLAIKRAKDLFKAEHVNVQPYSGSPANLAVYLAVMEPGDKLMGLTLSQGGHLTHGYKVSQTGKLFNSFQYELDEETGTLDYDKIRKTAEKAEPQVIVSGYSAYPREVDFKEFHEIAKDVGAYSMADIAHIAGLIAAGEHQSPFPFTDIVTTTTHKTLRGPRGGMIMCKEKDRLKEKYHSDSKNNLAQRIDKTVFPGLQGGPHMNMIAGKAVAFKEDLQPAFKKYAKQVVKNAKVLADSLMDFGFELVSGGTDNHLMLVDLTNKGVTGQEAETALDKAGITLNKNTVPFDKRKPFDPSGIRLGTPAITTRGMVESDMEKIAEFINKVIENKKKESVLKKVRKEVKELVGKYPLYDLYIS
ncbi:MAG: serine hydroxymethyltransferase [Candidatus Undinarchaeales archaeon]